jgi:membrane protein
VSAGTAIVVLAWTLTSLAFGLYVAKVADYNSIFGSLATVIILFEYLYLSACAFLTGALLDAIRDGRRG